MSSNLFGRIVFCFILSSFVGWIIESTYRSLRTGSLINSGFLQGPFIPLYGLGGVVIYYFYAIKYFNNPLVEITILVVLITALEYIAAVVMERLLNAKLWDYSGYPFNIDGRVCLLYSFFWAALTVFAWFIYFPILEEIYKDLSFSAFLIITILAFVSIFLDLAHSLERSRYFINLVKTLPELTKKNLSEVKTDLHELKEKIESFHVFPIPKFPSLWLRKRIKKSLTLIKEKLNERVETSYSGRYKGKV